jgi:hypothetical protein
LDGKYVQAWPEKMKITNAGEVFDVMWFLTYLGQFVKTEKNNSMKIKPEISPWIKEFG